MATGDGKIQWRLPNGTVNKILDTGITDVNVDTTSGMAFDACNNLYVTAFNDQHLYIFDETGALLGKFGSGFTGLPESMLFDAAGNVYVGQATGSVATNTPILKFSGAGTSLAQFQAATEDRGTDWIELAADQCTMFYTSEGTLVKRFDVCANTQLTDFNTSLPGQHAYALRLLPSGGLLVADSEIIVRLNSAGSVVQTYDTGSNDLWFALNLDPDGTSFWSSSLDTHDVVKFDISSGAVLVNFNAGPSPRTIAGITVNGEITVATPPPPTQNQCVTRGAPFWFTHSITNDPNCVTLGRAIQASCNGRLNLGFIVLPTLPRYENVTDPFQIALIESLGLYWRNKNLTGEARGVQSLKERGSGLCRARKRLAAELIAAIANTSLLRTDPAHCSVLHGGITTTFPSDLVGQARTVAAGEDVVAIKDMTALLRLFNSSGITNDFPFGLTECTPAKRRELRAMGRDPTTQISCPGVNETCSNAMGIVSFPYSKSIDTSTFTDDFSSPTCAVGGPDAIWRLIPPVAAPDRHFTVTTDGSNFDTLLSVWRGTCTALVPVTCNDDFGGFMSSRVEFRTDGTNTFFIVAEGKNGASGKLKFKVTSP